MVLQQMCGVEADVRCVAADVWCVAAEVHVKCGVLHHLGMPEP